MIRKAGPHDVRFLRDMLHHAFYRRERDEASQEQPVYRYVYAWGSRPGDAGVIALDEGFPVGAAWYRLFRADAPGYGFVDEQTPELATAVVPSRRGRGIGERLLRALMERAREEGHEALSLAVDRDNPALGLYDRLGFREVRREGETVVMVARLGSTAESD
ncbi:MAG TPA: GNAT family N-acetyltransferase [Gaiellaceae bacterium]|jgi:ribosomal protein S18 acetylase RimI-like enzyme|nr:GNAT family N-acetyltransferase [Gaiellaceae bacterium]